MSMNVLGVGNPGAGKSTLLNNYAQKKLFHSGASMTGTGVTIDLGKETHGGITYLDTPGLNDNEKRKHAAEQISLALKQGGIYKILFVMKMDDGRIRPEDAITVNLVLDAASNEVKDNDFAIVVNQVKPKWLKVAKEKGTLEVWKANVLAGLKKKTASFHFITFDDDLDGEECALAQMPPETRQFIESAPTVTVQQDKVNNVDAKGWEEKEAQLKEANEKYEQSVEEQKKIAEELQQLAARREEDLKRNKEEMDRIVREANARDAEHKKQMAVVNARMDEAKAESARAEERAKEAEAEGRAEVARMEREMAQKNRANADRIAAIERDKVDMEARMQEQMARQIEAARVAERRKTEDKQNLIKNITNKDWICCNHLPTYQLGIMNCPRMVEDVEKCETAYEIRAFKANHTAVNVLTIGIVAGYVHYWEIYDRAGKVLYTRGIGKAKHESGNWWYEIDAGGCYRSGTNR